MIYLKLFLTAVLWGGTFVAGRIVAQEVEPAAGSFLRFAVASLLLLLMTWQAEGRLPIPRRKQMIPLLLLGITGVAAYNIFFFLGLKIIPASRASLIVATNPVFIALGSALLFKDRLTPGRMAGIALCLTGAVVVISRGDIIALLSHGVGQGETFILGCIVSWVSYSLIGRGVLKEITPLVAVTYACLIGTCLLAVPAVFEGMLSAVTGYSITSWSGILFLGILGTVVAFIWYYEGIKTLGPTRAAVFINFVPVSGVILGWLILDETINLSLILGALLVISGAWLTNR
ncbi:MAG TPA: EamA family transporter [Syntrophus sp. (in: bacteria)]|nr:EamA family transporter [Syntrophus sp. (in: bacteria)]